MGGGNLEVSKSPPRLGQWGTGALVAWVTAEFKFPRGVRVRVNLNKWQAMVGGEEARGYMRVLEQRRHAVTHGLLPPFSSQG
jgi:hypothetical protein